MAAIGSTSLLASRAQTELSEFQRVQLKSAYSATRHLAVELESFGSELRHFQERLANSVNAAAYGVDASDRGQLESISRAAGNAKTAAELSDPVCQALDLCRQRTGLPWEQLRSAIRAQLRGLCNVEVELLATAIEGDRS